LLRAFAEPKVFYWSFLPTPRIAAFSFSEGLLTTLLRVGVLNPPLVSVQSESEQDDKEGDEGIPNVGAFLGVAELGKNIFSKKVKKTKLDYFYQITVAWMAEAS